MYRRATYRKAIAIALPCLGSAILFLSCGGSAADASRENLLTMRGDTITIYESEKGELTGMYYTPLMEKYENAPEPYEEYRYGVEITQYDSLGNVKSTFRANYAIHFTNLRLWETKGDVVVTNEDGDRLETQQLFWNRATGRVYSNVDSHFYRSGDLMRGDSFESNEDLSDWQVRKSRGKITINIEPTRDSAAVAGESWALPDAGATSSAGNPEDGRTASVPPAGNPTPAVMPERSAPSVTVPERSTPANVKPERNVAHPVATGGNLNSADRTERKMIRPMKADDKISPSATRMMDTATAATTQRKASPAAVEKTEDNAPWGQ